MLESVGKAPIVPGLLVTTFAGSTDEDIAEACEKMRAPKGQRWDVTAKIKARDEARALRSLLSRREQRKAFGTLVSQIEVKLLATAAEERDKADKADKALVAGAASATGSAHRRAEAQRASAPRLEASVASHADALQALRSELAASEAERDRLGEASARADGGAAETRGARDAEAAASDLRASSTAGATDEVRTEELRQRAARAEEERERLAAEASRRETELASLRAELDEKNEIDAKAQALALSEARGEVEALRRRLAATEEATRDAAATSRGNIRVRGAVPAGGGADADAPPVVVDMADGTSLTLAAEDDDADGEPFGDKKRKRRKELFSYDHVFGPSTGQERVFTEVAEFVQSALDGYQVCLFSYGQTGSGKTHTMQGTGTGPMRGIIPAMEQVRDLLADNGPAPAPGGDVRPRSPRASRSAATEGGRVYVDGCTRTPVDPGDKAMVDDLMQCAATHRCVAATDMNAVSSRVARGLHAPPHGTHAEKKARLKGALNLVDLAGSERLDRRRRRPARQGGGPHQQVLSAAGVFSALNRKQTHVPYRDSKLTFLLQPALSGDGASSSTSRPRRAPRTVLLAPPKQVQSVELGKAKRHIETVH
ncbi:hypothetical protein JL720_14714 [Aureococcus anophagefferens]|nr:hypothetical protein JL720_14714 [Aureococcus anophagefferens]